VSDILLSKDFFHKKNPKKVFLLYKEFRQVDLQVDQVGLHFSPSRSWFWWNNGAKANFYWNAVHWKKV